MASNMAALAYRLFTRRNCRFYSTHDIQEYFQYSRAIVGSLNDNFINGSIKTEVPEETIDLSKAKRDHDEYVDNLGKLLSNKITHIPENDLYHDQVFVEDAAVVYGGIALLTNMKMPSRHGERGPMKHALESLGLPVHEMNNPNAYLDGGDVLFTGREFFIGLSTRTNKEGIEEFSRHFKNWHVTGIPLLRNSTLHLKSVCSLCGIDTIAIGGSETGTHVWKEIMSKGNFKYDKIVFPDNTGANCLFVNNVVLHSSRDDHPGSYEVWQSLDCEKIPLRTGELNKADGCLTCCSILIN